MSAACSHLQKFLDVQNRKSLDQYYEPPIAGNKPIQLKQLFLFDHLKSVGPYKAQGVDL